MNFLHPPLWLYSGVSVVILVALWIGRCVIEGKDDKHLVFPKSELTEFDVGLPTYPWKPTVFTDLSRQRTIDVIFRKENSRELSVYRHNSNNTYFKIQELLLDIDNIHTALPIDYYGSGYNDLLIIHGSNSSLFKASVLRNDRGFFTTDLELLKFQTDKVPFIFDFEEDGTFDILYHDSLDKKYRLLRNGQVFPSAKSIIAGDFTKSGHNELLIEMSKNEYGIMQRIGGIWQVVETFKGPQNVGELGVGDFDGDGFLDVIIPVVSDDQSYLCIMFNSRNGFNNDIDCRNEGSSLKIPVDGIMKGTKPLIGDLTLEGNPDVGVEVLRDGKVYTEIFLNKQSVTSKGRRVQFTHRAMLEGAGGFFDLMNDGSLDIVTDRGSFISTLAENAYYLKIAVLNGQCLDGCSKGQRYPNPAPVATLESGATVSLLFTDKEGVKHRRLGVQRTSSGLDPPYIIFGLGDDVHYIDQIDILSGAVNDSWTWILPNSVLYATKKHQSRVYLMYEVRPFWVLFCVVSLMLTLGGFSVVFARQEDEEDKKEADEMLPLF